MIYAFHYLFRRLEALVIPRNSLLLATFLISATAVAAEPLPPVSAHTERISVSGLSSGAAMATQLSVAYSDRVAAVGMMAGPPYGCAQGASRTAVINCLTMPIEYFGFELPAWITGPRENIAADALIASARRYAQAKQIPTLENLKQQKVWVSRGHLDKTVGPKATQAVRDFYQAFGAQLTPLDEPPVPHTLPTDKTGLGACDGKQIDADYVSSCGIDNVGRMFGHLFGWPASARGNAQAASLKTFDQSPYIESSPGKKRSPEALSMATTGHVYIPASCAAGGCQVHVAIHGCQQGNDAAFDAYSRLGGYNEWAETHRLIVLYPRVIPSSLSPYNPRGYWDWWGYSPVDSSDLLAYAKRGAPQMLSIMNMVQALSLKPGN